MIAFHVVLVELLANAVQAPEFPIEIHQGGLVAHAVDVCADGQSAKYRILDTVEDAMLSAIA